jgi:hypothetical protein
MERDKLRYLGYRSMVKNIHVKEGALGFYRGYSAAVIGVTLIHGCGFFIFTKMK